MSHENLPVSRSIEFNLKIHELWELISRPGNLNRTHPYCLSNEVIRWDGEYHSDRLIYLNGRNYIRKFNTWNENEGYSLSIGEENGSQSFVEWKIDSLSDNKSLLTITIYPYILSRFPVLFRYILHIFWIKPKLQKYLESVLQGFLFYSERNSSVPRNHFGKHPWFS